MPTLQNLRKMMYLKRKIDLNCDLGESYGRFKVGRDKEIMPYITSANIACGFHAGDPVTMARTVELARQCKVAVGAHPGYPDLMGFGRREMKLTVEEMKSYIIYQIGALQAFSKALNMKLQHVKPHGALYDMASKDENLSRTIIEGIQQVNPKLILFAPPRSLAAKAAEKTGQPFALEAFADRAYNEDGTLVSRSRPNAVIVDPNLVAERAVQMINEGTVSALNDRTVQLGEVHTICVHGDTETAVELAKSLKAKLREARIEVQSVGRFL